MKDLSEQFTDPGPEWRGKPFWSWNGELHEEELIRQIHVMKEMGLGGFFMHSRTGLVTEYLGEEWFRLTNACADEAKKLGMEAWLYDEDRWPSGTAGGMVTENPEYRLNYLSLRPVPGDQFGWHDEMVAAFACHLEGVAFRDCTRLTAQTPMEVYREKTVLVFTLEEMAASSFYNGGTYVDTLNRCATEHYISLTHEQYQAHCGDRLGTSIRGIFTDEPHRGAVMSGFSLSNENRLWMTPWTQALPALFLEQFGHDLLDNLPALFLQPNGESVSPVKWQYMELLQQMFLENFAKPLYDWCDQNQMLLTGHVLHEDSLTAQAAMQGSLMRFYEYMHCPGVDVLTEGNRNAAIVKQLTSVARQLGQKWLLSELYGCTGWQMNFQSHKEVGDWQALFGINLRCHHLSWYTMEGEAKRDYPASILHQSAWWKDYDYVETYFARLGLFLGQGQPCCDVLVLNPVESVWAQIHVGWAQGLTPQTDAIRDLEMAYTEISDWLLGAHIDFDYGDEEMIDRLSQIEHANYGRPRFKVGHAHYRVVIVGKMTTMRASTLRLLDEFADAGGAIIFLGDPPAYVDAVPSQEPCRLAARCLCLSWEQERFVGSCRQFTEHWVEIRNAETGQILPEISCQLRVEGSRTFLLAINRSADQSFARVQIRVRGGEHVHEWDCRTGQRYAVSAHAENGWVQFTTSFTESGERAFLMGTKAEKGLRARPRFQEMGRQSCAGPFAYHLSEENVCVLDDADFRINDEPWQGSVEVLKADQAIRERLGLALRGGEMVQPWYSRKFQPTPQALAKIALRFTFDLAEVPPNSLFLCLERPDQWRININDNLVTASSEGWWIDTAFHKIRVSTSLLQPGSNTIVLETAFHAGINIEAIYLIGEFAVRLEGARKMIARQPKHLQIGDIASQGFPFYGGSLTYLIPLPEPAAKASGQKLVVTVSQFEAACLKIHGAGSSPQTIAFKPYRAEVSIPSVLENWQEAPCIGLEAVLTRRNTFGPLHQIPLRVGGYGPDNFTTTGSHFSDAYMLYPMGLLQPPILAWGADDV
jgi:hypothetical protein